MEKRQKQKQISTLTTVLAQFDIQTQVNKMVIRSFDTLMRSNKQAFDFIRQSQHKFINFQQRLSKAQTYYKNIQMNINSKVQLTNNMDKRLQQFANQFWNGMKQNNNQMINLTKKFQQLSLEKKNLQNDLVKCDKDIKQQQKTSLNLFDKTNQEIKKIIEQIRSIESNSDKKINQNTLQVRTLNKSLIEAKALLQSKSQILTDLLQDLQLYKNDRPQIKLQLQKLFEQLSYRSLKLQTIQLRGYVDSKIISQCQKINNVCLRLQTMIKLQDRDRKRQDQKIMQQISQNKRILQQNINQINQKIKQSTSQIFKNIEQSSDKLSKQIKQISLQLTSLQINYQKQIPQINKKIQQQTKIIQQTTNKLTQNTSQLKEMEDSVQSINQLIQQINKENKQRKQELNNLKANNQNQGNISQQVITLFQKIANIQKDFAYIKDNKIVQIQKCVNNNFQTLQKSTKEINQKIITINSQIQKNLSKSLKQITTIDTNLKKLILTTDQNLQNQIQNLRTNTQTLISDQISSIKHQLDQLDLIHQEIKQFKDIFKKQIEENQKVNASFAQKMERVSAQFTKLKSDNAVKFDNILNDLQKKTLQIKSSLSDLLEIKKYLSISNQCLNLLLALSIFKDSQKDSNSMHNANSSLHLPTEQKQLGGNNDNHLSKAIKVSSILQGWILQTQDSHQKPKYRGQIFNISTRLKLPQLFLQYLVKQTQKIKGTILQNGRDTFIKILQSGQDMFQQRKRGLSKRKVSQLPKLYM